MGRTIFISEFNEEKYPRLAQEFPDMRYHDNLFRDKWRSLEDAIDDLKNKSVNKRAKSLTIKLRTKEGRVKTIFRR